jgi:hypothetical protein
MSDYEKFLEEQNDEIIENLCKEDIEFWKETLEKESEEEPTVIVDEIYLIRLQSENTSMREALKKIVQIEHEQFGMGDIRLAFITMAGIAQKALDKVVGV